jgi:hypothetical protein
MNSNHTIVGRREPGAVLAWLLPGAVLALALAACQRATNVYPPSFPDSANAATDPARATPQPVLDPSKPEPPCDRKVPVLEKRQAPESYDVAAEVTVSCPPGAMHHGSVYDCDERLRKRACQLDADAILVDDPSASSATQTATLVRWKKAATPPLKQ